MEKITIIIHDGVVFVISHSVACVQPSKDDFITSIDAPFEREMGKRCADKECARERTGEKFLTYICLEVGRCCVVFSRGDQQASVSPR